jgi:hypothetical protein
MPVKDSHTRIKPLTLASGHGRYVTVTWVMAVTYKRYKFVTISLMKRSCNGRFASERQPPPASRSGLKQSTRTSLDIIVFSRRRQRAWLEGGSVNSRCFQVEDVSRKAGCVKPGRERRPRALSPRPVKICRRKAAGFPLPSFSDSPFLYPVFAIVTGVLKTFIYRAPLHRNMYKMPQGPNSNHGD